MTTVYPSSDGYFQQDNAPCLKAQIISDWFLERDYEFTLLTVTRSQYNRAPLGCGGTGDSQNLNRNCSNQICRNCVMLSCQYGPKSLRNVSNTLLYLCHKELRQIWRQKGVQPGTSKVYLIKWPVSVCVCVCIYTLSCCFQTPKCKPRGRFLV